ncbi:Ldh family oxidoreductase [Dinoroseobacter sp. S375]|uniref:Ldh family oxidoreductase n=1 Tax=Dinoroseobacter sp. S375 TaxID=3415136 RepID=UPI003C7CA87E
MHALVLAVLQAHGADEANAAAVAETVTRAERDRALSHGLFRVPGYVKALQSGKVKGDARPVLNAATPAVMRCDGGNAFAPMAHKTCLPPLIEAAQTFGLAGVSIQRCHHFAALWPEIETLAEAGLVGITCVSYLPWVAPHGGQVPIFGTNPFGFAWPRPGRDPIVIDMATAAMAMGEVQIAAREGQAVPLGTGLSPSGELTTDAAEIAKGVLLPFGGHKGSALALMIELLAGPMVGEAFSFEAQARDNGDGGPAQGGQFILAMSPAVFSDADWAAQTERFVAVYDGIEGARLPGAKRHAARRDPGVRAVNTPLLTEIRGLLA